MSFGTILKDLLKEHGLTQSGLASEIGYTQRAISKWINQEAEPTESAINRVANYFHVTSDALLGRTTDIDMSKHKAPSLTAQEQQLIRCFRELPESSQDLILGMVKSAADAAKRA